MVLLAKNEPGMAAGIEWEKAGDEGAVEVHPRLAHELLSIPGDFFYVVEKVAKKVEKAVVAEVEKVEETVKEEVAKVQKAVTKKAAPKAEVKEDAPAADIAEAIETASPTKRRSTKE